MAEEIPMPQKPTNKLDDKDKIELVRLWYAHVQTIIALSIVAALALGGFICIIKRIEGGQTIVAAILGLITGWIGGKRTDRRKRV
jgi:hypothetical protein